MLFEKTNKQKKTVKTTIKEAKKVHHRLEVE